MVKIDYQCVPQHTRAAAMYGREVKQHSQKRSNTLLRRYVHCRQGRPRSCDTLTKGRLLKPAVKIDYQLL
eukprot:COSAG01_NODE_1695_length_9464_cov_4.884677_2_plen_70_part_00